MRSVTSDRNLQQGTLIPISFAGALLLIQLGCGDVQQQGQETRDGPVMESKRGTVVVHNGPTGLWNSGDRWTVREEFRIGGAAGPPETLFGTDRTSVSRGPGGNLFVLDGQAEEVMIFDRAGHFIQRIGGPGDGPAEFYHPAGMGWDPLHRLWIANGFNLRYTVFDSTGTFLKTMPRPIRGMKRPQFPLVFDSSGSLLDEGLGIGLVRLIRVDTAGARVDTLPPIRYPDRPWGGAIIPPDFDRSVLRYLPELRWVVARDHTVWVAETGELRLVQRTWEGDTIRIVETRHRDPSLDDGTRQRIDRELKKIGWDGSEVPLAHPIVHGIHIMDDGHILVQIVEEVGHRGSGLVDVFDPQGRFLGSMRLGFKMTNRGMPALFGDTLVGIHVGEHDVPYLVRAVIERPEGR